LLGRGTIGLALNREDRVDAAYPFDGEWRLAQIRQLKEFTTTVAPAGGLGDRVRFALDVIEIAESGISVGLEDPGIAGEVTVRVLAAAVARIEEQRRRGVRAGERLVIPDIGPEPADHRLLLGQHRHGRVVAVDPVRAQNMTADQFDQRRQVRRACADPVRQGRHVELDTLPPIALALPV
jgi:hypothetical protein